MPVDVKEAVTRKLGPLPAWGWGVAIGGAFLAFRVIRPKSASSGSGTAAAIGSGPVIGTGGDATPTDVFSGANSLVEQLQGQVDTLSETVAGQEDQVAGLSGTITTLTSFQALQTKLIEYLRRRTTLLTNISTTNSNLSDYKQNLAACTTQACKDKWNAQITQKNGYLVNWNTELAGINDQIANAQEQLNGANA